MLHNGLPHIYPSCSKFGVAIYNCNDILMHMPITIRDKEFDQEMADEARLRGGISKTAAIMSLAAERRAQLKLERNAALKRSAKTQPVANQTAAT